MQHTATYGNKLEHTEPQMHPSAPVFYINIVFSHTSLRLPESSECPIPGASFARTLITASKKIHCVPCRRFVGADASVARTLISNSVQKIHFPLLVGADADNLEVTRRRKLARKNPPLSHGPRRQIKSAPQKTARQHAPEIDLISGSCPRNFSILCIHGTDHTLQLRCFTI